MMKKFLALLLGLALLMTAALALAEETVIELSDDGVRVSGSGVTAAGNDLTVFSGGTYVVTGSLSDGSLTVDTAGDEAVLILRDMSLARQDGEAIVVKKDQSVTLRVEGKVTVSAKGGSDDKGAVRTKSPLSITGDGTMLVEASGMNGIHAADDLSITGVTMEVRAEQDALRVKGDLTVSDAVLRLDADGKGIQTGDEDEGLTGGLALENSTVSVISGADCIQLNGGLKASSITILAAGPKNAIQLTGALEWTDSVMAALTGKAALKGAELSRSGKWKLETAVENGEAFQLASDAFGTLDGTAKGELDRLTVYGDSASDGWQLTTGNGTVGLTAE